MTFCFTSTATQYFAILIHNVNLWVWSSTAHALCTLFFPIYIASCLAPRGTVAVVHIALSRFIFWEMADQLWIRAEIKRVLVNDVNFFHILQL